MQRYDIINSLINKFGYKYYLEIGFAHGGNFELINCDNKSSVDPGFEVEYNGAEYKMTSDDFFQKLEHGTLNRNPNSKWDIIFIDGMHLAEYVLRDIKNSLNHLSDNGTIVLHDCSPPEIDFAREDYYAMNKGWNGTVWKSIYHLRVTREDLIISVVDTDYGVGIIRKGSSKAIPLDNPFYEYNKMSINRNEALGLLSPDQFISWIGSNL